MILVCLCGGRNSESMDVSPSFLLLRAGNQDFTSNITKHCLEVVTSEELERGGF